MRSGMPWPPASRPACTTTACFLVCSRSSGGRPRSREQLEQRRGGRPPGASRRVARRVRARRQRGERGRWPRRHGADQRRRRHPARRRHATVAFLADAGLGAGNAVTPYGELVGSALLGFDPSTGLGTGSHLGSGTGSTSGSGTGSARVPAQARGLRPDSSRAPDPLDEALVADTQNPRRRGIRRFLLTATALGSLFKANASIPGAEGGCQAEVGSACAMAAGGLTAVMGGTTGPIENAAEIAMEHHLGLACDPSAATCGSVRIERTPSRRPPRARPPARLRGDGSHYVSLDAVVETCATSVDSRRSTRRPARAASRSTSSC